jgi:hypothetical protein
MVDQAFHELVADIRSGGCITLKEREMVEGSFEQYLRSHKLA